MSVAIDSVQGRLVRNLVEQWLDRGVHNVFWNGRADADHQLGAGVCFLRFKTDDMQEQA